MNNFVDIEYKCNDNDAFKFDDDVIFYASSRHQENVQFSRQHIKPYEDKRPMFKFIVNLQMLDMSFLALFASTITITKDKPTYVARCALLVFLIFLFLWHLRRVFQCRPVMTTLARQKAVLLLANVESAEFSLQPH